MKKTSDYIPVTQADLPDDVKLNRNQLRCLSWDIHGTRNGWTAERIAHHARCSRRQLWYNNTRQGDYLRAKQYFLQRIFRESASDVINMIRRQALNGHFLSQKYILDNSGIFGSGAAVIVPGAIGILPGQANETDSEREQTARNFAEFILQSGGDQPGKTGTPSGVDSGGNPPHTPRKQD